MSYRDFLGALNIRNHAALDQAIRIGTSADTRIAELEAALAEARRDADRYRWLRDESGNDHHTPWCAVGYADPTWLVGETLDAAIDAARGAG